MPQTPAVCFASNSHTVIPPSTSRSGTPVTPSVSSDGRARVIKRVVHVATSGVNLVAVYEDGVLYNAEACSIQAAYSPRTPRLFHFAKGVNLCKRITKTKIRSFKKSFGDSELRKRSPDARSSERKRPESTLPNLELHSKSKYSRSVSPVKRYINGELHTLINNAGTPVTAKSFSGSLAKDEDQNSASSSPQKQSYTRTRLDGHSTGRGKREAKHSLGRRKYIYRVSSALGGSPESKDTVHKSPEPKTKTVLTEAEKQVARQDLSKGVEVEKELTRELLPDKKCEPLCEKRGPGASDGTVKNNSLTEAEEGKCERTKEDSSKKDEEEEIPYGTLCLIKEAAREMLASTNLTLSTAGQAKKRQQEALQSLRNQINKNHDYVKAARKTPIQAGNPSNDNSPYHSLPTRFTKPDLYPHVRAKIDVGKPRKGDESCSEDVEITVSDVNTPIMGVPEAGYVKGADSAIGIGAAPNASKTNNTTANSTRLRKNPPSAIHKSAGIVSKARTFINSPIEASPSKETRAPPVRNFLSEKRRNSEKEKEANPSSVRKATSDFEPFPQKTSTDHKRFTDEGRGARPIGGRETTRRNRNGEGDHGADEGDKEWKSLVSKDASLLRHWKAKCNLLGSVQIYDETKFDDSPVDYRMLYHLLKDHKTMNQEAAPIVDHEQGTSTVAVSTMSGDLTREGNRMCGNLSTYLSRGKRIRFEEAEILGLSLNCEKVAERFPQADVWICEATFNVDEVHAVFDNRGALKCARGLVGYFGNASVELFLQSCEDTIQLNLDIPDVDRKQLQLRNRSNRIYSNKAGYVFPLTLSLTLFGGSWNLEAVQEHFFIPEGSMCQAVRPLLCATYSNSIGGNELSNDPFGGLPVEFGTWKAELVRREGRFPFLIVIGDAWEQSAVSLNWRGELKFGGLIKNEE